MQQSRGVPPFCNGLAQTRRGGFSDPAPYSPRLWPIRPVADVHVPLAEVIAVGVVDRLVVPAVVIIDAGHASNDRRTPPAVVPMPVAPAARMPSPAFVTPAVAPAAVPADARAVRRPETAGADAYGGSMKAAAREAAEAARPDAHGGAMKADARAMPCADARAVRRPETAGADAHGCAMKAAARNAAEAATGPHATHRDAVKAGAREAAA